MEEMIASHDDAKFEADQTNSALLQLPAELRNKIYVYVSDTMTLESEGTYLREVHRSGNALRLVCRQMNREASSTVDSPRFLCIPSRSAGTESREMRCLFWNPLSTIHTLELDGSHIMGEMRSKLMFFRLRGIPIGWADNVWVKHMFPNLRFIKVTPMQERLTFLGPRIPTEEQIRSTLFRIVSEVFDRPDLEVTFV